MSLALPSHPRRAMVRSFWIVLSVVVGVIVSGVLGVCRTPLFFLWGLVASVLMAMLVFLQEGLVRGLYHAWNDKLVIPFARFARVSIVRILFYTVFAAAGRKGLEQAGIVTKGSIWMPRVTLDPARYSMLSAKTGEAFCWRREYRLWVSQTGNTWALSLLPFLVMLRMCAVPQEQAMESHIYTLF